MNTTKKSLLHKNLHNLPLFQSISFEFQIFTKQNGLNRVVEIFEGHRSIYSMENIILNFYQKFGL